MHRITRGGHIRRSVILTYSYERNGINRVMKKLLTFIVTTAMLLSLAVIGVSADATYSDTKPSGLGEEIFDKGAALEDITEQSGSNIHNLASGGSSFCVKADSWVRYEFDLDVAGTYTFVVTYIARDSGTDRGADYAIDSPDNRTTLDLEQSDDTRYAIITEELDAGTHSFYWLAPTGFDDTNLKSNDCYGVALYLTEAAPAETEAPADAAEAAETAPQTADVTVIATVVLAVSATAAIIVAGKRH